jgi:hypothetical protein
VKKHTLRNFSSPHFKQEAEAAAAAAGLALPGEGFNAEGGTLTGAVSSSSPSTASTSTAPKRRRSVTTGGGRKTRAARSAASEFTRRKRAGASATPAPGAHLRTYPSTLEQRLTAPPTPGRPFFLNQRDNGGFLNYGGFCQPQQQQQQQPPRHFLQTQSPFRPASATPSTSAAPKVPDTSSMSPVAAILEASFYDHNHHHHLQPTAPANAGNRQLQQHILQPRTQAHQTLHSSSHHYDQLKEGGDVGAATALLAEYCFEPSGPKAVKLEAVEERVSSMGGGEVGRMGATPPASETGSGSNLEDLDGLTDLLPLPPDFRVDVGCIKDVESGWDDHHRHHLNHHHHNSATSMSSSPNVESAPAPAAPPSVSNLLPQPMSKPEPPMTNLSSMFPQVAKQSAPSIGGGLAQSAPFSALSSALHGDAVYQDWLDQIIHI